MPKDRFWRNVTLIALAHIALLLGLIRWSVEARNSSNAQSIVWISGAEDRAAGEPKSSESPQPAVTPIPPPGTEPLEEDEAAEETAAVTAAKSEIELPSPTPKPTATATATPRQATPKPKPKATPKPAPASTPKKTLVAKASPKPSPKAKPSPAKASAKSEGREKVAVAKKDSASQSGSEKTGSTGKAGTTGGGSNASEFGWYGNMLHDRFYSAWIQPTTTVASGSKISTLVKVRIEKDGRVSNFEIIKPSENVVVNESVAAVAKRVTEVDPPPADLGNGDYYDVNINFELNTDQGASK
jgi:outer membrane biosynthesis protein TonB